MSPWRRVRVVTLATLIGLSSLAAACGDGVDTPSATNLETSFEVTPQEDAALLDSDMVDERLSSSDATAGEYRFSGSVPELASLRVGQPVVIPNAGFGIVRTVTENAGETVLQVDEATLGDIIDTGTLEWDYDVSWSDFEVDIKELAATPGVTSVRIGDMPEEPNLVYAGLPLAASDDKRKIEIEFESGGWVFKLELEPKDDRLNVNLDGSVRAKSDAAEVKMAGIVGKGWVSGFNYSSFMEFEGGTATSMSTEINGLQGEMEVQWAAFRTERETLTEIVRFEMPATLPIPLTGPFGIPFVLNLTFKGRIVPELSVPDASSGGSWKVSYTSDQGFGIESGGSQPKGSLRSQSIDTSGETVTAGHGPAGFGVGMEFPRFELAIVGVEPFAFITLDTYATSLWTPGTTLTSDIPPCQYGYAKISSVAGYQLKIAGLAKFADQHTLWEKQVDKYLDGKVCTLSGE